jgi:hypothetical protein
MRIVRSACFSGWEHRSIHNTTFFVKHIDLDEQIVAFTTKMSLTGFYVATTNTDIFSTFIPHVIQCAGDENITYDLLNQYADEYCLITCPIIDDQFSVTNNNANKNVIIGSADVFAQLIDKNCYVICNGLTLFIALLRLRIIDDTIAMCVLVRFFHERGKNWYPPFPAAYYDLYVQHRMPQVSEYPFIYACMGKHKVSKNIIDYIVNMYDSEISNSNTLTEINYQHAYYTSMGLAALPFISAIDAEYYKITPLTNTGHEAATIFDVGGLLRNVVATRGMWRWWRANHEVVLYNISQKYHSTTNIFYSLMFKRLFQLYNEGTCVRSRVRQIWIDVLRSDVIPWFDPSMWIYGYLKALHFKQVNAPTSMAWLPEPPVAFFKDVLMNPAYNIDIYRTIDASTGMSIHRMLEQFHGAQTTMQTFARVLSTNILKRMTALKHMCSRGHNTWHAMQMFIQEHPTYLYT